MKNLKNMILLNQDEETKAFRRNETKSYKKDCSKKEHKEIFGSSIDYKRQKTGLQCKRGGGVRGVVRTMRLEEDALIRSELGI